MSLKVKLTLMCMLAAIVSASSGAIGFYFLNDVSQKYSKVSGENLPAIRTLADLRATIRELRIHVRSMGLEGNTQEDVNQYAKNSVEQVEKFEQQINAYLKIDPSAANRKSFQDFYKSWTEFKDFGVNLLTLAKDYKTNNREIVHQIRDICGVKANGVYVALLEETHYQTELSDKAVALAHEGKGIAKQLMLWIAIGSIFAAGLFSFFMSTKITAAVKRICDSLAENSASVQAAATTLTSASSTVHEGSFKTASMLESSTASMTQISSMVNLSSEKAGQARRAAEQSKTSASDGSQAVGQLIDSMNRISNSSKRMQDIITIIEDISFQTNLLALNAAVEAARAGEAGKGFAVVAEAVRSLAGRSTSSAKEISDLIKESSSQINEGVNKADQGRLVLERIVKSVEQVTVFNHDIASSSEEQKIGIGKVEEVLSELDRTSQANTEASEQVSKTAMELNEKTESVDRLIFELRHMVEGNKAA